MIGLTLLATSAGGKGLEANYRATFSGDLTGSGLVKVTGNFLSIRSDAAAWDFGLTFGNAFGGFAGTHTGRVEIWRQSSSASTAELTFTYPEGGTYYQLHGFGAFEGSVRKGWFKLTASGQYTLLGYDYSIGSWVVLWTGTPNFTTAGQKL